MPPRPSLCFMRSSVLTALLSFLSLCLCMFSLMYPAWLQQSYAPSNDAAAPITYQGFGLFAFYSTNTLNTPFYASVTTMFFADFCDGYASGLPPPNWMLGNAAGFHEAICDTASIVSQYVMYAAAGFAAIALVAAIVACFVPVAGTAERTVSLCTFMSCKLHHPVSNPQTIASVALCLVSVLVMWSVWFQQKLLSIDVIQTTYSQCHFKEKVSSWNCWFYGTYASAAGRVAKLRQVRKVYDHQLVVALQESVALTAAGLPTLQNDTRFQLLSPGKDENNRALAMALRQSKEAHDVELAMDESLRQHQLDQNNSPWIISQRNLSKDQPRGLDSQKRLGNLYG
ncbi:hypothetical protein, variant 1 [Aphanomyces astaci]|uniref:Uncharacterized protein n=1 Tax=Aphanomyces astaci TaxID=112090 RepID=W4FQT9_APHAT|nr:hypothetical protein, variant 1 [Aphanomyces astaci]ETV69028.1 hypothetical protein, variant 1 [Aphanomyces astaci]|eukprot:XP_009841488.1 hypothetical protein, variant 1 [Aphanomyces astaci]